MNGKKLPPEFEKVIESELALATRRDPDRIDRVIEKIRKIWKANPDWRIGQLVVNMTQRGKQIFYVEDDVVEAEIDRYIASMGT